jgi:cytochrome c-type biogenesis protein CcmE
MKPRHKRIAAIVLGVAALGVAAALVLSAFNENLVFFFTPSQIVAHEAPQGRTFRIGGMVEKGSVRRQADGVFRANEVLAKHDENYMPPEAAEAVKRAQEKTSRSLVIPDRKP